MSGGLRVLVAEDEDNVRFVVTAALELAGYEVSEAPTGGDALRLLSETKPRPDLVVLDVMLPGPDGFEVCSRVRSLGIDVPIMFLTARDEQEDRIRGLSIGADDYLAKPFSVEELLARVGAVMRRSGKQLAPHLLCVGDLKLDDDARLVHRGESEVDLSPTEYKLLRFLMRNAGRALSRAQILDHVWDYDFDGESTVVESFISQLRKKLDAGHRPFISTVRGFGYRLDAS